MRTRGAEMTDKQQEGNQGGFTRHVAKKALGPIVTSAATAGTAYLMRKGSHFWKQTLRPKIEQGGGGKAVASDALDRLRGRLPDSAGEKLDAITSKVTGDDSAPQQSSPPTTSGSDGERDEERRQREQRRQQRKRALEQARSSR